MSTTKFDMTPADVARQELIAWIESSDRTTDDLQAMIATYAGLLQIAIEKFYQLKNVNNG